MGLILSSCESTIYYDLPEHERKIAIIGTLNPDSSLTVHLSKSFLADPSEAILSPGEVVASLFEDGQYLADLSHVRDNFYGIPDFYPVTGKEYSLEVSYGELRVVKCHTQIPERAQILALDTITAYIDGRDQLTVNLKIMDQPGVSNYYALGVILTHKYYDRESKVVTDSLLSYPAYFTINGVNDLRVNTNLIDIDINFRFNDMLFVTDALFDGQEFNLNFSPFLSPSNPVDNIIMDINFYQVTKSNYIFAESYYNYYKSLGSPLSEPVQVYSNIENGLGLFSGIAGSSRRIFLRR